MMVSAQIRAARALLRWSAKRLAEESGVSLPTIKRMEAVDGVPKGLSRNLEAVQRTLERAGIGFIEDDGEGAGVRLKSIVN